jgi:DeoR/GlpR family transcriptional regulator of sugar metabolism
MPKTQTQRKGEIVYDLQQYGTNTIPQRDFEKILEYNNVTNNKAQKDYTEKLVEGNYLERVEGGLLLTDESRKEGIIVIKVRPSQHTAAVRDSLTAALQQFRPLTTMELEG